MAKSLAFAVLTLSVFSNAQGRRALPDGTVGQPYRTSLAGVTGKGSSGWQRTRGALPDGLSLQATGAISGTPERAGRFDFTISFSQTAPAAVRKALDLSIRIVQPVTTTAAGTVQWIGTHEYRLEQQVPAGLQLSTANVEFSLEERRLALKGTANGHVTAELFLSNCRSTTVTPGRLRAEIEGRRTEGPNSTMELQIVKESWNEIQISPCSGEIQGMPGVIGGGRIYKFEEALRALRRNAAGEYKFDSKTTYPSGPYNFTVTHTIVLRRAR